MYTDLSLVNQKLTFARTLLALISTTGTLDRKNSEYQSLCEGALLHLYSAYHFYLRELASVNLIQQVHPANSLAELRAVMIEHQKFSSEVQELWDMSTEPHGWFSDFLQSHQRIFASPTKPMEKKSFGRENFIELIEVSSETSRVLHAHESITEWVGQFENLVRRQRACTAEY